MDLLAILSRWAHIASMAFLAGGALYAHLAWLPAISTLSDSEKSKLGDRVAESIRTWIFVAIALLLLSGMYNFYRKPAFPSGYHAWFGVKMLFALHIIAVSILTGKTGIDYAKRKRWAAGLAGSALVTIAISAVLRWL